MGDQLIYKHPLIQYKVFGGSALIVGLKEGAYLLKAIPTLEYIEIHHKQYPIVKQSISTDGISFGLTSSTYRYSFVTPWIALNEDNYKKYLTMRKNSKDANTLLGRILIGNILSMYKSIGYVVEDKVQMKVNLVEDEAIEVKKGIEMISFQRKFETNFLIPDFWGIGKSVSRGFGTVKRVEEKYYPQKEVIYDPKERA